MGATLFQGPHFHFNFLLNRVDVCGESHGKTALSLGRLQPPVIHWLEYLCDLVSARVCDSVLYTDGIKPTVTEFKAKRQVMRVSRYVLRNRKIKSVLPLKFNMFHDRS